MGLVVIDPDFCRFRKIHGLPPSEKGLMFGHSTQGKPMISRC
jgi:hypothetical protein